MRKLSSLYFVILNSAEVARGTTLSVAIGEAIKLGATRIESGYGDVWIGTDSKEMGDPTAVWSRA